MKDPKLGSSPPMTVKTFKGEMMIKQYFRILMALVGFTGLGITAKAQVPDQIVVTIPFEFVAAGKTLPSGTYRVNRLSDDRREALILSSFENDASAIVLPTEVESAHSDNARATFQKAGDQHFLSKIETDDNVFTIAVSRVAMLEASAKSQTDTASESSSGSN
jgi:hypothetical protein